ncbi:hypothetical protein QBC38DRAFT_82084 [Podospora fimiseda]|uniref:Uncharacterized protein n=1 Tax=Podospora fimiseda TaxID=252190 RepID=A0AAN6YPA3_9PEZI|nr:hypothetical protein QBC38DRAFT_82084 [Podospora fimiseda]
MQIVSESGQRQTQGCSIVFCLCASVTYIFDPCLLSTLQVRMAYLLHQSVEMLYKVLFFISLFSSFFFAYCFFVFHFFLSSLAQYISATHSRTKGIAQVASPKWTIGH